MHVTYRVLAYADLKICPPAGYYTRNNATSMSCGFSGINLSAICNLGSRMAMPSLHLGALFPINCHLPKVCYTYIPCYCFNSSENVQEAQAVDINDIINEHMNERRPLLSSSNDEENEFRRLISDTDEENQTPTPPKRGLMFSSQDRTLTSTDNNTQVSNEANSLRENNGGQSYRCVIS